MDIPIAFTSSQLLQNRTSLISQLRAHILTTPIAPHTELAIRSAATHTRILVALTLAHIPMTSPELSRLLLAPPKRPHPIDNEALLYRQALVYIRNEWTGQLKPLTLTDIEVLMHISLHHYFPRISRTIQTATPDLVKLLAYIETSNDHPVLLAGIVHAYMAHTGLHTFSKGRLTLLLTSLIMARAGYDTRGMLSLESGLIRDLKTYQHALSSITSYGQMTIWLEYFTDITLAAYKELATHIETTRKLAGASPPIPLIHDRQKQILLILDTHGAKITNREVQKRFHISQITASRDLSKLVSGGFIVPRGKGRSVSYSLA